MGKEMSWAVSGKNHVEIFLLHDCFCGVFMTKYPRFKIHSKYRESCKVVKGERVSQGNQFDVFSTGSFSLFTLTMSSEREQPVKLGIFSFLLELTMDTSIEILGNDGPSFLYMFGAGVYCVLLILVKSYLDSLMENSDNSVGKQGSYEDRVELSVVLNARDVAAGEEQPLIESKTGQENRHEIGDNKLSIGEIRSTVAVEEGNHISRGDTETGDEGSVYDVSSHLEDGTQLPNHRERHTALRREKAKREREREEERKGIRKRIYGFLNEVLEINSLYN